MNKENKIKILQVNKLYHPWIGGVEQVVQDIAEGLKDQVNMEVLACEPKGRGESELINGVKVTKASSFGIYFGMPVSATLPFLLARKSRQADILHFHLPFPLGVVSHLLMGSKSKKIVVSYHSDIVKQEKLLKLYRPFLHNFLDRADVVLPTSPRLLETSSHLGPYKNKCTPIPLSIDLDKFGHPPEGNFDLEVSSEEQIVLFVGRLAYYKGLSYLIEAMEEVEAKLLIAGEGDLREELKEQVSSLGLEEKITFLGRVSDEELKHLYQHCDLFVLPSVKPSEAFGIVQMEAMAYGKPVVNTSLPTGVPYVSKDGETGLTVPPRNSEALAKAIKEILTDRNLREKFSKNAKERVREKFSREKMLNSIYSVYEGLME